MIERRQRINMNKINMQNYVTSFDKILYINKFVLSSN